MPKFVIASPSAQEKIPTELRLEEAPYGTINVRAKKDLIDNFLLSFNPDGSVVYHTHIDPRLGFILDEDGSLEITPA